MSQNGAHRKGIQSLRGEVARFTIEQELEFAHLLLPDKPTKPNLLFAVGGLKILLLHRTKPATQNRTRPHRRNSTLRCKASSSLG